MRKAAKLVVYVLLVTGAAVFAFPFLWMAATSVKVDREVQSRDFRLMPMTPLPQTRSPYIDDRQYAELEGPYQAGLLPRLRKMAKATGFKPPRHVNAVRAWEHTARGLYDWLRVRLPKTLWDGVTEDGKSLGDTAQVVAAIEAAARVEVTRDMVAEVFDSVYRRLLMGPIRVRSYGRLEAELGEGADGDPVPLSKRLENRTADALALLDVTEKAEPYALLRYDLSRADRLVLTQTFAVPHAFDLSRLHRIAVDVRPDDTWHDLWLTAEYGGVRYEAERALPLANFDVLQAQWQPRGPDDYSTKIKTWIRLDEAARGASLLRDPHTIRLTFEFRRSGAAGAWWNKLKFNYTKVLDYMPFLRYLRVSLFLAIATIVLTLAVSSLVAYAFARLNWPGREFCFILMLATMMIPFQVIMIPRFLIWKHLGAYNTLTPLWLGPAFGGAFFIFLLRQFLKGIPRDLEDAARLDGCGFLRIYWHIMLPLIKPSLAAIAIFTFMATWNNFMGPLIYIADQRLYPLAFGLYAFSVQVENDPALTMAASLLMTVPVIVIFFFAQKHFIQGITLTGMKG